MKTLEVKCGRDIIILDENDLILDNGACFQILTKRKTKGWCDYAIKMANKTAKKLIKDGKLVLDEVQKQEKFDLKYYRLA